MARQAFTSEELRGAVEAFKSSRRYMVLKNLQLGRIVPEECHFPDELGALTLEQLVAGGVDSLARLHLTPVQHDSLIELLRSLSAEEEILAPSTSHEAEDSASVQHPQIGSIQLELLLRQHLSQITSHERYGDVRRRAIGEFWDSAWTPAPFEEALRIEQLANMDVAVLFKKRSVNDNRIYLLCQALDRVVSLLNTSVSSQISQSAPLVTPRRELPEEWRQVKSDLTISEKALCAVIYRCSELPRTARGYSIALAIMEALSQKECISIVCGEEMHPNLLKKIRESLVSSIPAEVVRTITVALQGPGVHARDIASLLRSCEQDDSTALEVLATVSIRALGGEPVRFKGEVCPGFWTSNPELFTFLMNQKKLVAGRAELSLDPFLLDWITERQGRKRKGKKYPTRSARKGRTAR